MFFVLAVGGQLEVTGDFYGVDSGELWGGVGDRTWREVVGENGEVHGTRVVRVRWLSGM